MLSKSQLLQKTGQCIVKKDTKQKTSSESWDHSGGMQTQFSNYSFPRPGTVSTILGALLPPAGYLEALLYRNGFS